MKILHFIEGRCNADSANGVDKTIYYLTRAQAALGHEVHIVSETEKELIPIPGVVLHRTAPTKGYLRCPQEVKDIIDKVKPDVGHFHSAYVTGNICVSRHMRRRGIPYAVTPNGNCSRVLLTRRPWLKIPYKLLLERPYMNRAAFVHSVGDRREIEHYGITVPIVDALNGIDPDTIPDHFDTECLMKEVPAFKDHFVCAFVGRLDIEQKGLDLLVEAVKKIKNDGIKVGILLIGPEWKGSKKRIEEHVREAGVKEHFHFYGPAYGDKKFDLLVGADVFIYPSRWEGLPFAVVEAMAAGQLCLVTPASDPAGLLAKDEAGVVFPTSVDGIADGIRRAAKLSEDERKALLSQSTRIVREEMNWEGIARKVIESYEKAVVPEESK